MGLVQIINRATELGQGCVVAVRATWLQLTGARFRWCWHLAGHRRGSVSWSSFGNDSVAACHQALKNAWETFLTHHALPLSACPIVGVFP